MVLKCLQKGIVSFPFARYSTFESINRLLIVCTPLGCEMSPGQITNDPVYISPSKASEARGGAWLVPLTFRKCLEISYSDEDQICLMADYRTLLHLQGLVAMAGYKMT